MTNTIREIVEPPLIDGRDVADRLAALRDALPRGDGVWWFVTAHVGISRTVATRLDRGGFDDPALLEELDTNLVGEFLAQVLVSEVQGVDQVRRAWRPLFAERADRDISPLRFALAGINAHIGVDLPLALVATTEASGKPLERGSGLHHDYWLINELEEQLRDGVERAVFDETMQAVDDALGALDDRVKDFSFAAAREAAWINAELLIGLPELLEAVHLGAMDRTTGFVSRLLLH